MQRCQNGCSRAETVLRPKITSFSSITLERNENPRDKAHGCFPMSHYLAVNSESLTRAVFTPLSVTSVLMRGVSDGIKILGEERTSNYLPLNFGGRVSGKPS